MTSITYIKGNPVCTCVSTYKEIYLHVKWFIHEGFDFISFFFFLVLEELSTNSDTYATPYHVALSFLIAGFFACEMLSHRTFLMLT